MTTRLQSPKGPIMSFIAIPCPLPNSAQTLLKSLANDIRSARTKEGELSQEFKSAMDKLSATESNIREILGSEMIRRSFIGHSS